jgi:ATP-dependent DNA helicase RecG
MENQCIANVFFRSGQIESWGRGIDRIKEECQRFGAEVPSFESNGCDVLTIFQWDSKNYVIINEENDTIKQKNNTVNQKDIIINKKNFIINKKNVIINKKNVIINKENVIINKKGITQKTILQIITENENISADEIAKKIEKTWRTTMRYLEILKKENKIEYYGSRKTGGYRIKINNNHVQQDKNI